MRPCVTYKLKGSSLVEVLIALAITSFALVLASMLYLRLQKSSLPFLRLKATDLAESTMEKTLAERALFDEQRVEEGFTIKRTIKQAAQFPDCRLLHVLVLDASGKLLCDLETLVYTGR